MKDILKIQQTLSGFTGSAVWTKWSPLFPLDLLTEGARYVAEECGAYWLMDAIASHQMDPKVKVEEFQVWVLYKSGLEHKTPDCEWMLSCEDGNDNDVATQAIAYSDFPLPSIKLYAVRNELGGITIMLPSEY